MIRGELVAGKDRARGLRETELAQKSSRGVWPSAVAWRSPDGPRRFSWADLDESGGIPTGPGSQPGKTPSCWRELKPF